MVFEGINIVLKVIKMFLLSQEIVQIVGQVISHTLFYPYGALGYIQASIVGVLFLWSFIKRKQINQAIVLGLSLYLFALLANNYYFVACAVPGLNKIIHCYLDCFISARNGLFVGFFLLGIGIKTYDMYNNEKE